ncbi:MAG: hypothetical protein FWE35_16635 [Streptosporangiales bacterium]|nr:hypothetical protein [Streptosporangiales bacterium]
MIRRGFWLTVGAAGGIWGYRRVVSAGRTVSGKLEGSPRSRKVKRGLIRSTVRFSRDAHSFTRDVREGMELYIARQPDPEAPNLPPSTSTDVKDGR